MNQNQKHSNIALNIFTYSRFCYSYSSNNILWYHSDNSNDLNSSKVFNEKQLSKLNLLH